MTADEVPVLDVVVFGATGNIGSAIVSELMARGHRVTGITRTATPGRVAVDGVELRRGDVTDPRAVAELVGRGRRRRLGHRAPGSGRARTSPSWTPPTGWSRDSATPG